MTHSQNYALPLLLSNGNSDANSLARLWGFTLYVSIELAEFAVSKYIATIVAVCLEVVSMTLVISPTLKAVKLCVLKTAPG